MTADGVALCELFAWVAECDETHKDITETDVSDFLHEARAKIPGFFDESFTTIAAYGANAAQPHYTPKAGSAAKLTGTAADSLKAAPPTSPVPSSGAGPPTR